MEEKQQSSLSSSPSNSMHFRRSSESPPTTAPSSPAIIVADPAPYDILCGRDKTYNQTAGNQAFRALIAEKRDAYAIASNKHDKMKITKDIVRQLQQKYNSRFVKLNKRGQWEEISETLARDKVSHALRFASRRLAESIALAGCSPADLLESRRAAPSCHSSSSMIAAAEAPRTRRQSLNDSVLASPQRQQSTATAGSHTFVAAHLESTTYGSGASSSSNIAQQPTQHHAGFFRHSFNTTPSSYGRRGLISAPPLESDNEEAALIAEGFMNLSSSKSANFASSVALKPAPMNRSSSVNDAVNLNVFRGQHQSSGVSGEISAPMTCSSSGYGKNEAALYERQHHHGNSYSRCNSAPLTSGSRSSSVDYAEVTALLRYASDEMDALMKAPLL